MNHYLETGELLPLPTREERREMILRHAKMQLDEKGENCGMREMRKHVAWYTAGLPHSARLRGMVGEISTYHDLEVLLENTCKRAKKGWNNALSRLHRILTRQE